MLKTTLIAAGGALLIAATAPNFAHADQSMFDQGSQDRGEWEQWFNSLPAGDYKTGAFFWASQRSLPNPQSCKQMNDEFYKGCTAAKVKLSPTDTLRKTEPDYKTGWNTWTPTYNAPAPAPVAPSPQPAAPALASAPDVTPIPVSPAPQPAAPSVRWYVGHLGAESCVPLADVGDRMERLYYGTGSMRTPEDMAASFRSVGGHTQWVDAGAMAKYSRIFRATGPGLDTYIMIFNDKDACQLAMSMIEK